MERKTNPDPADLEALVRVLETGSFSAVARERDVPASNISRAIDRLEAHYAVRLLRRSTHGLSATAEGELLAHHAREVLARLEEASAELSSRASAPSGLVRVSVSQVMASRQLLPSLPRLLEKYPQLRVEVLAEDRMVDLATEGIDLAVRTQLGSDQLVAKKIGEFERALFAAPAYLQRFGTPLHPDDLRQHQCITHSSSGSLNRWRFRIDRRVHEVLIHGFHRTSNTDLAFQMVRSGLGIGRINTSILGDSLVRGEIVPVLADYHDKIKMPIYVVMQPDRHRLPKIRLLIEHLQKVFR